MESPEDEIVERHIEILRHAHQLVQARALVSPPLYCTISKTAIMFDAVKSESLLFDRGPNSIDEFRHKTTSKSLQNER